MESSAIRNELNQLLKEIYSKYDAVGTGTLEGDKLNQFIDDFIVTESEGKTLEGFKSKFWKEFNKFDEFTSLMSNSLVSSLTNKSLTVRVNNDETKISKTSLNISYDFQAEKRQTLLNDLSQDLSLNANDFFAYVKLFSDDPASIKETLDNILKLLLILAKSFLSSTKAFNFLSYNISTSEDFILVKFTIKHPLIQMFHDSFLIVTKYFQNLEGKASINLEATSTFDDLINNLGEDVIRTFLNGSKLSINVSTNCYNSILEVLKKFLAIKEKPALLLTVLSLLDFNADFSLKMGDVENTLLWNQIPDFKPFDSQNIPVKTIVNHLSKFTSELPILKKVLEFLEKLKGKIEVSLNTAWGLLRLKAEASGLLEIWNLLKTIHY